MHTHNNLCNQISTENKNILQGMNVSSSEILNFIVATLQRKNEISPNKTFYLNIYFISNIFHLNIQNSNGILRFSQYKSD